MQISYLYPGIGQPLRKVAASTGNAVDTPNTTTIPSGGYTEGIAAHDCIELTFNVVCGASSALSYDVEVSSTPDFANSDVQETVQMSGRNSNWSPNQRLVGFYRIHNNTGTTIVVNAQKRIG